MLGCATWRLSRRRQAPLVPPRSLLGIGPPLPQTRRLLQHTSLDRGVDSYGDLRRHTTQCSNRSTIVSRVSPLGSDQAHGPFRGSPTRLARSQRAKAAISRSGIPDNSKSSIDLYFLMRKILDNKDDSAETRVAWRERVAQMRSDRPAVILLQMIMQEQAQKSGDKELLSLLPNHNELQLRKYELYYKGFSAEDLEHYRSVLVGETDDARCKVFLSHTRPQPIFLLNFLLRRRSSFWDPLTLAGLIDYCRLWYNGRHEWEREPATSEWSKNPRALQHMRDMDVANFSRVISLLSYHCQRLEPRLIVKVAELAARRIETLPNTGQNPDRVFHDQCGLLNECLEAFQFKLKRQIPGVAVPNGYFWEAQRMMLDISTNPERSLLVNSKGFRAIRHTLAGLPKNPAEKHSSSRHSPNWPPYLRPADGMDEGLETDDGWSRAVQAGVMMQEAGFSKEEVDESLDILQGVAPDGTPTIQQRITTRLGRTIGPWEASIRATRNAQEAWMRFQEPPEQVHRALPHEPGPDEYAAMFEKLLLSDNDVESSILPGDKALNFPTAPEANLSDIERARLQPPSISELYREMRAKGVETNARCLRVLLESANSYASAHDYLRDSAQGLENADVLSLTDFDPLPFRLKKVDMGVFVSYIQACTRIQVRGKTRVFLTRAIRLIDKRMGTADARWTALVWRPVLKVLDLPARMLGLTTQEQLELIIHAIEKIEAHEPPPLSIFVHICRCVRNIIRREVLQMAEYLDDASMDVALTPRIVVEQSLGSLYFKSKNKPSSLRHTSILAELEDDHRKAQGLFEQGAQLSKRLFHTLVEKEKAIQTVLQEQQIPALERMLIRKDPVRADHAHEYMLLLAFVGEFKEMLAVARWLVKEWGHEDVVEALSDLEDVPHAAALSHPLCAYRLLAEPRLDPIVTATLREGLEDRGLGWMWPSDEAVQAYGEGTKSQTAAKLARVLSYLEANHKEHPQQGSQEESRANYEKDEAEFLAEDLRAP